MQIIYGLYVISTGEKILEEEVNDATLCTWQKRTEKKMSRRRNRAQRFRDAIKNNDTIASWENFDELSRMGVGEEKMQDLCSFIFRGYDKWFNERSGYTWNARID